MIGRMSSMQLQGSLDVILDAQARLQRTQEELASGKRVLNHPMILLRQVR